MDHKNHDKVFFVNFGLVLGAIGGLFFACIIAARTLLPEKGPDPDSLAHLEQRIHPVGHVVTDPNALVQAAAAKAARAPYTGDEVVAKVCTTCHQAGVLGAPKIGDKAAWAPRLAAAGNKDNLAGSAIKGKGSMPPRGGGADLSDDEVKAAVATMLKAGGL